MKDEIVGYMLPELSRFLWDKTVQYTDNAVRAIKDGLLTLDPNRGIWPLDRRFIDDAFNWMKARFPDWIVADKPDFLDARKNGLFVNKREGCPVQNLYVRLVNFDMKQVGDELLDMLMEKLRTTPPDNLADDDLIGRRLEVLRSELELSADDMDMACVAWLIDMNRIGRLNKSNSSGTFVDNLWSFEIYLKKTKAEVMRMLSKSKLFRFCLLDKECEWTSVVAGYLHGTDDTPVLSRYYEKDEGDPGVLWEDFSDMVSPHGDLVSRIVSANRHANILLYGLPGTGKTSFAKALVRKLNRPLYSVAQFAIPNSEEGKAAARFSPTAFRFNALAMCDESAPEDAVILVDESDDLLTAHGDSNISGTPSQFRGDKGTLNSLLDSLHHPVIWASNTPAGCMDPSSRRRFAYAIKFEKMSTSQRRTIWRNAARRFKMDGLMDDDMLERLAVKYPVSAGGISIVLENVSLMKPGKAEVEPLVEDLMKSHCELMGVSQSNDRMRLSGDYSLEGLNIKGDVKLDKIAEAIDKFRNGDMSDPDIPRMNLLLSGPPGTGKTEFVKYLGNRLHAKVNVKMGSDLLSMWVGGTEQNIANAFREAEADNAILFLDELDGLVQTREKAMRSWEVTQVNELLQRMEAFKGVLIGATNFVKNLDQAIMRRFTFKLQFDWLDAEGKELFFERMFKSKLADADRERLVAIPNLAPGDFRTVRQSLFYYADEVTNVMRLDALEREASAKDGSFITRGRLGF